MPVKRENVAGSAEAQGLQRFVGRDAITQIGPDPVNAAMIRHWCSALGDRNPVYLDQGAAARSVHGGLIAPPAMLQAWTMPGYGVEARADDVVAELHAALDALGFSSVIATNCEQEYMRAVRIGDALSATRTIESVSDEKATKLGPGFFITTAIEVVDQAGELVGRQLHRVLKFRPERADGAPGAEAVSRDGMRPRPVTTQDTAFFFEGAKQHRLLIQRCAQCATLRHPPTAACAHCGSLDWAAIEAAGRGTLFSYTVVHAPTAPGFEMPHFVGLVELEEGTRVVADLVDVDPADVEIGMALEVGFLECDPGLTLPAFRPAAVGGRPRLEVGTRLPALRMPLDRSAIVAAAIASRDFQPLHHDPEFARERGLEDIITNILTSNGLVGRFVTDWAGPDAVLRRIAIRLGVPNYPGDVLVLTGTVAAQNLRDSERDLEIAVRGANRLGDHLTGTVTVTVPPHTDHEEGSA